MTLRHPDAVRPWQHVLDPLAGYLRLAERLLESAEYADAVELRACRRRDRALGRRPRVRALAARRRASSPPGDSVEAPALRLDAAKARERLGWEPRLATAEALVATVFWHDSVREGADARTVTLTQIEEAS